MALYLLCGRPVSEPKSLIMAELKACVLTLPWAVAFFAATARRGGVPCQLSVIHLHRSRPDFVLVLLGGRCQGWPPPYSHRRLVLSRNLGRRSVSLLKWLQKVKVPIAGNVFLFFYMLLVSADVSPLQPHWKIKVRVSIA